MNSRNIKLFILLVLFIFSCIACSSPIPLHTPVPNSDTPTELSSTKLNKTDTPQITLPPTHTVTVTPTALPATPIHETRLIYDPQNRNLTNPQETPIYSLTKNKRWVRYLPDEIRNNLPQGWGWGTESSTIIVDKNNMPIYKWNEGEWEVVDEFRLMSLEERLDAWVSGELTVEEDDLWTLFGDPYPLGVYLNEYKEPSGSFPASTQFGVLLGLDVVDDFGVLYIGFADAQGNQFYVPYKLGVWRMSEQVDHETGAVFNGDREIDDKGVGETYSTKEVWEFLQDREGNVIGIFSDHARPDFVTQEKLDNMSDEKRQRLLEAEEKNNPTNKAFYEFLWRLKDQETSYQSSGVEERFNINQRLDYVPEDSLVASGVRLVEEK